jgi:hypothetical protein
MQMRFQKDAVTKMRKCLFGVRKDQFKLLKNCTVIDMERFVNKKYKQFAKDLYFLQIVFLTPNFLVKKIKR